MNWRLWTSLFALSGALSAQTSNVDPRTFWDNLFRNGQISFNREANRLLQYAVNDRRPGAAIDLGMGEGRNAVFLASKGWRVTGVDFSAEAVKQAKSRAAAAHVTIDAIVQDLEVFELGHAKWDLIALFYMHGWFHESKRDLPRLLVEALRPGGLLVIEGYAGGKGDYQTNELLNRFSTLKILHYEDVRDEADWAPGGKSRLVRFIAEKLDGVKTP